MADAEHKSDPLEVRLSVVIPVYNERECLQPLYRSLSEVLDSMHTSFEIVFVDDGSTDGSSDILDELVEQDPCVRVIRFRRNFGQTAALSGGFDHARGQVIVTMDADGQNDPADIPLLVKKLDEGCDVVNGWRKNRKDPWLLRKVPSRSANILISLLTGVPIRDFGCTLKAYRRWIVQELAIYGEMHRMIPVLAHFMGARITEVEVRHHNRPGGKSKYSIGRALNVVLDLFTLKFFLGYFTRPLHFFGLIGALSFLVGMLSFGAVIYMKFAQGFNMTGNPFLSLGVLCVIVGTQLVMLGLLGEITVRTYFESQDKPVYVIKEIREH